MNIGYCPYENMTIRIGENLTMCPVAHDFVIGTSLLILFLVLISSYIAWYIFLFKEGKKAEED